MMRFCDNLTKQGVVIAHTACINQLTAIAINIEDECHLKASTTILIELRTQEL